MDITWKNGKLVSASIVADTNTTCPVKYNGKIIQLELKAGKKVKVTGDSFGK